MAKKSLLHFVLACGILSLTLLLTSQKSFAALAEFGAVSSNEAGKTVFAVSDGSTFARYCLVELTVKDKKIHWISHPLEKEYVKREPEFIHNFNKDYLVISTKGQKNKDKSVAQIHLYHKPQQELHLLAEASCEFPKRTIIKATQVEFDCGKKKTEKIKIKTSNADAKTFEGLMGNQTLDFTDKSYKAELGEWKFEVKQTDNYFKDRLQIVRKEVMLKEYEAKDFARCFDYETLKGSQEKF